MGLQRIVVLCIIGIIVIGGGWYFISSKDGGDSAQTASSGERRDADTSPRNQDEDTADLNGKGPLASLLSLGKNITCEYTFTDKESGSEGSGTSYFSGERMRVDSDLTEGDTTYTSHVINDGEKLWTWTETDEGTYAFVMTQTETETTYESGDTPHMQGSADTLENDVDYKCESWRVDDRMFVPPSNIDFVSPDQMMQGVMESMEVGMTDEMQVEMQEMLEGMWNQ